MLTVVLSTACQADSSPRELIATRTVELQQTDEHVVASIADVLSWGNEVVVVDRLECNVKLFDPVSGRLTQVLGRRGSGPGEFLAPRGAAVLSDGRLAVYDALLQRVSLLDRTGDQPPSWPVTGIMVGSVAQSPAGTLLLTGRLVGDEGVTSRFELHEFDLEGNLLTSSEPSPEPRNFGEAGLDELMVEVVGDSRITLRRTSNRVSEVSLATGAEREYLIGRTFYRPPTWDLEPGDTPDDVVDWQKRNWLAWHLAALGDDTYAAGFIGPGEDGTLRSNWVLVRPDVLEVVVEAHPNAVGGPAPDGSLALVEIMDSGVAQLALYDLADMGAPGAL